jgi:hypothetical protein
MSPAGKEVFVLQDVRPALTKNDEDLGNRDEVWRGGIVCTRYAKYLPLSAHQERELY